MADCKAVLRQWCSELVSVILPQAGESQAANLEEIGESSALVLMDHAIRAGTRITLNCRSRMLRGIVASCTLDEHLGFFIEILLDAGSMWSPHWFAPEHLLPPLTAQPPKAMASGAA